MRYFFISRKLFGRLYFFKKKELSTIKFLLCTKPNVIQFTIYNILYEGIINALLIIYENNFTFRFVFYVKLKYDLYSFAACCLMTYFITWEKKGSKY